jgi:ABC-type lipoprotein export system ATPase subunit/ABC-type antimicrobial peptide transport system permease subunit
MLRLVNISKYYLIKNNKRISALKNISLSLPEKGLFSFIGKSGSGKSTLLNILGGIDKPDSGTFLFNGKNTNDYNSIEWDNHRGKQIGFIFQEYNLIAELNVADNIALSLGYQEIDIQLKVKAVLKQVGLSNYESRSINELSGGEKQRIAIARALVKNPAMILADEPTGSLDKESSLLILKILKEISQDKLVILVTHDDKAIEFSDIIYELRSGELIGKDIKDVPINKEIDNQRIFVRKLKLPFKYTKKIALSNLFENKIRLFFTLILFVMSLMLVFITFSLNKIDFGQISFNTFKGYNINEFNFDYSSNCSICIEENQKLLNDIQSLQDKYHNITIFKLYKHKILLSKFEGNFEHPSDDIFSDIDKIYNIIIYAKLTSKDILYGNLSTKDNEILLTDYIAYMLLRYKISDVPNIQQLVGKDIIFKVQENNYHFKIAGIINTDCEKYMDYSRTYSDKEKDIFFIKQLNNYSAIYFSKENLAYFNNSSDTIQLFFHIEGYSPFYFMKKLSSSIDNETVVYGNIPTNKNEIMLTLPKLLEFEKITANDFLTNKTFYINKWVNKEILLMPGYSIDSPLENGYKIVGILDKPDIDIDNYGYKNSMIVTDSYFDEYYNYYFNTITTGGKITLDYNHEKQTVNLINNIDELGYEHSSTISTELYNLRNDISFYQEIIFYFTLFSLILTSLLLYTYISSLIENKKIQIGILRSLGISAFDCGKIFVFAIMLTILFVNVVNFSILIFVNRLLNNKLSEMYNFTFNLFYFNTNVLVTLLLSCLVAIIASFIPLKRIIKMKPIDAIRNKK